MPTCPKCGATLREGAIFCSSCGTKIEASVHCPKCGAELPPDARFCDRCGTQIGLVPKIEKREPSLYGLTIDGDFVYLGRYPQSLVPKDLAWELKNIVDPNKPTKVDGKLYAYGFGPEGSPRMTTLYRVEPIRWRILKKEGDSMVLLSQSNLDWHIFDSKTNQWASSALRKWLNKEFIKNAFTEEERELLLPQYLDDKISVLFPKHFTSEFGLSDLDSRRASQTDYSGTCSFYWTGGYPSSEPKTKVIAMQNQDGRYLGQEPNLNMHIRPVITVKIGK